MTSKHLMFLGALLLCLGGGALAADATVAVKVDNDEVSVITPTASAASSAGTWSVTGTPEGHLLRVHRKGGHALVSILHNQTLNAGEHADDVVGVLGNSDIAGDVSEDVVSILGNVRVTGPVKGDVVAVLGNAYIDSPVDGDVVAVLGRVELGPHATVGGELNTVGGTVTHVNGAAQPDTGNAGGTQLNFSDIGGADLGWLDNWVTQCLLKGRLLAFGHGFYWAWAVALVSLAFYALTALILRNAVARYTQILEEHPGESLLAGFLAMLATPVLLVLLCITVIGILAVPFIGLTLLALSSFGKAVVFAWLGYRILNSGTAGAQAHPALAVLVGGLIVTLLYAVPVIGMLTFQVTGFIGMGVVVYGLMLALRQRRASAPAPLAGVAAEPAIATAAAAGDAAGAAAAAAATLVPGAAAAVSYPRAGFWIRMFALFIDAVLIGIVAGLVLDSHKTHLVLLAIYGAVMWKLKGATLGDMICHLHVTRLDGRMLDWPTASIRALSCFLSLFVVFLGFIWIAVDPERQAWHDKIAGTVVVRTPKGVSLV